MAGHWSPRQRTNRANTVGAFVFFVFFIYFFRDTFLPSSTPARKHRNDYSHMALGDHDVEMVVASMKHENVSWLDEYLPEWKKNIYVVDDNKAKLTVPTNKGREAMVFLTYIIDRYDSLPGNVVFHHAERFQWHNDNPDYDALPLLQNFRFDNLKKVGYANLRCVWVLGCPAEIRPIKDEAPAKEGEPIHARHVYKAAFQELFPSLEIPEEVGVTCCSQFAVRRETIHLRPRAEYVRFREWLIVSALGDDLSGRVLEYSWHIIFGKPAVNCPNAADCYCQNYGMCDLKCEADKCEGQYTLPPFSTLPKGWPQLGWKGENRGWKGQP
ncbi:hypothetical protein FANTH_7649 [Fusarium anthophilum]|uniref:Uncharacterized protein n=1 Tax=Fusarium anthophilum TaxID=48485 RepID=A0A8H4ZEH9_9HYPO|nr:hypothetical protein FANTH_7649 [Fusarium anthophilum]KAF5969487.1 hypothetical protein FBULB1_10213 [Fusarium bulbicola]